MSEEIWKPSEDGLEVSNFGRVRRLARKASPCRRMRNGKEHVLPGRFMPGGIAAAHPSRSGYLEVAIMRGGVRQKYRVHRLVAQAFCAGYFDGGHVDHVDGNKLNNRADNLEWVTCAENTRRQWESGLVDLRGDLHPGAKLSNLQAHAIRTLRREGFPAAAIAEWFGVAADTIYAIASGDRRAAS